MRMGIEHLPILVLLLGVAVLFFGPKRLPELGHGLGKAIKEFKKAGEELTDSIPTRPDVQGTEVANTSAAEAAPRPTVVSAEAPPKP
jgi:sec-independent protein translocase protein TatA